MGVLGYREGGARACVESLLREGSEASGHELDHGDVDSGFRSLRASLKVFAQPASKGFAQVIPQTAVDGLARTAALPYLEVAVNGPKCPRVARQQTPLAARAQTVADRVDTACIAVIRSCLSGFVDGISGALITHRSSDRLIEYNLLNAHSAIDMNEVRTHHPVPAAVPPAD